MWYRIPLFNGLANDFDIKFLFTNENKVEGLEAEYEILRRYGFYPFITTFGLIPKLIKEDYDVVVFPPSEEWFNDIFCFIISKLRRKPYIIWSDRWICKKVKRSIFKKIYYWADQIIMRYLCKRAGACVTSGGTKQKEYFMFLGVIESKIFISAFLSDIPAKGFDIKYLEEKKKIEKKLGIENKKIVLCVARLIERKGIDYLIKAFAKLKKEIENVSLVIVGGEDYYGRSKFYGTELKTLCKTLTINEDVHFIGYVKSDDLSTYYLLCDLFVYPSIANSFADTGCLPISDVMYFGKPVISTDVVGFAYDLIKNAVNGFMVPEKDVDALYKAIKTIISNPDLERKMGIESKRIIKEGFTSKHMVMGFKEAIEYVTKNTEGMVDENSSNRRK